MSRQPNALRNLGQCLRHYRQYLFRVSQNEMARRIGVARSTYVRMESGDGGISIAAWVDAWSRMNLNKATGLTVLDALLQAADPGDAIMRQQADEALHARIGGDAVEEERDTMVAAAERALAEMQQCDVPPEDDTQGEPTINLDDKPYIVVAASPGVKRDRRNK